MKKMLVRGLLACSIFACGGGSETAEVTLPEPGRLYEEEEVWPEAPVEGDVGTQPELVDVLDNQGERVEFWRVIGEGGEEAVLIQTVGDASTPRLGMRRDQDASAAEIWRAITGLTDVPTALLLDHERVRTLESKPLDLRDVDLSPSESGLVQKATAIQNNMFPLASGTCWRLIATAPVVMDAAHPMAWFCSGQVSGTGSIRRLPVTHSTSDPSVSGCGTFSTKEATRNVVHYKDTTGLMRSVQTCYRETSSGPWSCLPVTRVLPQQYQGVEYPKTSTVHAMQTRVLYPTSEAGSDNWEFGTSKELKNEVPQFQSPQCAN